MAKKSGLGRGLGSLISGGGAGGPKPVAAPVAKKAAARKTPAKKQATSKKNVPAPAKKGAEAAVQLGVESSVKTLGLKELPIGQLVANPHQPRREFDPESLHELKESIRSEGLLQPVVARTTSGGTFELIAGERRWRACKELKMKTIPVRVIEASETSSAVLSMIENLQREDLNPIEEALGYVSLLKDFNLKQEQVAERVGRSRASIANSMRLLNLPSEVQSYLTKGHISVGHAKVLLGMGDKDQQIELSRRLIQEGWSVRELEKHLLDLERKPDRTGKKNPSNAAEAGALLDLQNRLSASLSTPVHLKHSPRKGKIIIEYFGNEDLQRILEQIGVREG